MKKLIIIAFLMLVAVPCFGAEYYVKPATGANSNAGTSEATAFKNLGFVTEIVTAGDTVTMISTATAPIRDGLYTSISGSSGNIITWQGQSNAERAWLVGSINVSEGATIPDVFHGSGDMEGWEATSAPNHDLWWWTEDNEDATNTIQQSTTASGGTYSAVLVRADANVGFTNSITLAPSTSYTLSYDHQETENDYVFLTVIRDTTTNDYLQDDLSWGAAWNSINGTNSNGSWATDTVQFTTQAGATYAVWVYLGWATTSYLDNLTLTDDATTYQWAVHDGDTDKLTNIPTQVRHVTACATAEWASDGVEALDNITKASSLANCIATAGTWWWASGVLYFHPATGGASDYHVEAGTKGVAGSDDTVYFNTVYNSLKWVNVYSSNRLGIALYRANATADYCLSSHSGSFGIYADHSTSDATVNDCIAEYTASNDGIVIGQGTMTARRVISRYNQDEGIEAYNGGTLDIAFFASYGNGTYGAEEGVSVIDSGTSLTAYHGSIYGNYGHGISVANNDGTIVIKNVTSDGNNVSDGGYSDVNLAAGQGSVDADYNCYTTSSSAWDAQDGSNNIKLDPLFKSATNFRLKAGSPAINTGLDVCSIVSDGNGDAYDLAGRQVCKNGAVCGPWANGVDIGSYGYKKNPILLLLLRHGFPIYD